MGRRSIKKDKAGRAIAAKMMEKVEAKLDFSTAAPRTEMAYPKAPKFDRGPGNRWDLSDLYSARARYTAEERMAAVTAYVMTGTIRGVVRLTGYPYQTIHGWKNNSSWWPDAYRSVKKQKEEEMDAALTTIVHAASAQIVDRILNGDEVLQNGIKYRRLMSGKELAWTMGVTYDKRALLRGDPTSRTEKVDTNKMMEELKENFESMAKQALEGTVVKTINEVDED